MNNERETLESKSPKGRAPHDHPTTAQPPTVEDTTTDHEDDIAAINKVIADIQTGFNANDPDLSVEHFTQNASVVNVSGMRLSGRDALLDANRRGLAGPLRDQYARYEVGDVVFPRPDVVIAHKRAWATTWRRSCSPGSTATSSPTL